ncbi:MAG TPA: 6-phosphogluconolactonase [Gaiellaceae bacterium]|nr:6-phosphogluconolactonase [Gaiellaceae bacterium]
MSEPELRVLDSPDEAFQHAAGELAEAAHAGLHIALSGGSVAEAFARAGDAEADWSRAEVWWGDERCVPPDDERSNYRLARENLLDRVAQPPRAVHRIQGELEPPRAAALYDEEIDGVRLGLAFQGIGPDGHTGSLFPHDPAVDEVDRRAVAVHRDDVDRVTLTLPVLCAAETVLFLAFGEAKAEAIRRAFAETPSHETPASLVRSTAGRTVVLLDRAAAARLPS